MKGIEREGEGRWNKSRGVDLQMFGAKRALLLVSAGGRRGLASTATREPRPQHTCTMI